MLWFHFDFLDSNMFALQFNLFLWHTFNNWMETYAQRSSHRWWSLGWVEIEMYITKKQWQQMFILLTQRVCNIIVNVCVCVCLCFCSILRYWIKNETLFDIGTMTWEKKYPHKCSIHTENAKRFVGFYHKKCRSVGLESFILLFCFSLIFSFRFCPNVYLKVYIRTSGIEKIQYTQHIYSHFVLVHSFMVESVGLFSFTVRFWHVIYVVDDIVRFRTIVGICQWIYTVPIFVYIYIFLRHMTMEHTHTYTHSVDSSKSLNSFVCVWQYQQNQKKGTFVFVIPFRFFSSFFCSKFVFRCSCHICNTLVSFVLS